ncbi:hypothetical protein [Rhodococcoides kyotonense]|uniref:Uncharacterized protein n=1 Tax=Rhodococcoides kyotonense TaxID=398843 RepID=A0A239MCQ9_9NOCA|nr:hypothetical protein [Rhodococcus kyotonensis]SNT40807.1 hypothetical protein SAMN05421642_11796 [Rhodococcus kyotonensis]
MNALVRATTTYAARAAAVVVVLAAVLLMLSIPIGPNTHGHASNVAHASVSHETQCGHSCTDHVGSNDSLAVLTDTKKVDDARVVLTDAASDRSDVVRTWSPIRLGRTPTLTVEQLSVFRI